LINKIVFICGALRSGSSLTHLMLDHHPCLKNPGEFDFLFDQVADNGKFPEIKEYHDWLSTHRIFQSKNLEIDESLPYVDLINSFISQLSEPNNLLALNIHRNFDRIPFIFPDAKFIHLVRDPRDVARSSIGMGWAGNVYYGVDHWIDTELSWEQLQQKISLEQHFEIRFEDLILSPEEKLKSLCNFMGVEYSAEMLGYVDNSTYSKPDPSLVRQWKTKLTTREIQHVEFKAKPLMQELGYALSGHPLVEVGFFERLQLKIGNKVFRFTFAIKRYGFALYVKERFSRTFKLSAMNKQTKIAINEVSRKHLK